MCGIAGFIHYKKTLNEDDLKKMVNTINYRGPDDDGYYLSGYNDFQVGMGFRRLAILDLSNGGHQPMFFMNLVVTLNGEIYNFKEIREDLKKHGYSFVSHSDTEVVIKAFHLWGIKMVELFIGMFAIAIYDNETHELYLVRDRIGIKPLYYYFTGNDLVYASELKPIFAYPFFSKKLNYESLSKYLYHGYITGTDSIFKNVCKLEPGSYLKLSNGKPEITKYWNLPELYIKNRSEKINSEEECLTLLDDLLTSSIGYRMISDVPIGSFLSGGFDSSLTTAVMQKLSDQPINTFTIGFDDIRFNEAENAKAISGYLGTHHHELTLPIGKAKELIEELPTFYDEPFGDSSALPTILVSRLAKKNATVILSGDGGDELFCGYNNYEFAKKMSKFMALGKVLNIFPERLDIAKILFGINRRFGRYPYLNSNINIININYILSKYSLAGIFLDKQYTLDKKYFNLANVTEEIQELYMLNDMVTYLPDDILTKVDRASMSVSLEARVPILDHRIVEFSFKVPHHLKYNNGTQKYLLKTLAYKYIPETLLDRPKQGFAVPVFKWLKSDLHYLIDMYLSSDYLIKQQVFNPLSVRKLLQQFISSDNSFPTGNFVWNILMFQLWYEKYMK
jgi:asparagine synthase (glutamine-hydrolysing)